MMENPTWEDGIRAINITYFRLLNMGVPKERLDEVRDTLINKLMDAGMKQVIQDGIVELKAGGLDNGTTDKM